MQLAGEGGPDGSPNVGWQIRDALLIASVHDRAQHVNPRLLEALLKNQVWTPMEAMAYAQQIVDPARRVESPKVVACHVTDRGVREQVLGATLESVRTIADEQGRSSLMIQLFQFWELQASCYGKILS